MWDKHHKFSQHKNRKKKYGRLIHDFKNLQIIDHDQHMSGRTQKLSEREFLRKLDLLHCKLCNQYSAIGCLWDYGYPAEDCRYFDFNKEAYDRRDSIKTSD